MVTLYTREFPIQGVLLPVMGEGCVGVVIGVTESSVGVPAPQLLEGVTFTLPDAEPTVTVIELVVPPAVCVHPVGRVQL